MRIDQGKKYDYHNLLLCPKRSELSSRADVDLTRQFNFRKSGRTWSGVPIMAANMDTIGTFEMAHAFEKNKMITALHKHYEIKDLIGFYSRSDFNFDYVFYSMGMQASDMEKLDSLMSANVMIRRNLYQINVDVPNGYTDKFSEFIRNLRSKYPRVTISAGNVCTPEMTQQLLLSGADIVKVGIGPGSACTTRITTGVGYPQLSAIMECSDAAHGLDGHVIGDGGIVHAGDFAKGFAGGADFLMAGGIFAGHIGPIIEKDGAQYLEFYGMSSRKANQSYAGGLKNYRASEGRELLLPYRGPIEDKIQEILGGLRSAGTYIGARNLKNFSKCATFVETSLPVNTSLSGYAV